MKINVKLYALAFAPLSSQSHYITHDCLHPLSSVGCWSHFSVFCLDLEVKLFCRVVSLSNNIKIKRKLLQ